LGLMENVRTWPLADTRGFGRSCRTERPLPTQDEHSWPKVVANGQITFAAFDP
jgi:hypothetical protein